MLVQINSKSGRQNLHCKQLQCFCLLLSLHNYCIDELIIPAFFLFILNYSGIIPAQHCMMCCQNSQNLFQHNSTSLVKPDPFLVHVVVLINWIFNDLMNLKSKRHQSKLVFSSALYNKHEQKIQLYNTTTKINTQ